MLWQAEVVPIPPVARTEPTLLTNHGVTRTDPYYWMNDRESEEVLQHLAAENAHFDEVMAKNGELTETIYNEYLARIVQSDLSVPVRRGDFWYYVRTVEGLSYPIFARRVASGDGTPPDLLDESGEEIVFDENVEAGSEEFFSAGNLAVSPDHQLLAYATDTEGSERYRLSFRRISDGSPIGSSISDTYYGLAWSDDARFVFYTRVDETMRPHQVWRHELSSSASDDVLVFQEDDARFSLSLGTSRDRRAIVVHLGSKTSSECWLIDPADPTAPPVLVEGRRPGHEYAVDHHLGSDGIDRLLILTNDEGADFRLVLRERRGGPTVEVIPHRPGTRLDDLDTFSNVLAVTERLDGAQRVRILDLADGVPTAQAFAGSWLIEAIDEPSTTWVGENPEFATTSLRFGQTSMVEPSAVLQLDLATRNSHVLKQQQVLGGFSKDRYSTTRISATAPDGTKVSLSLVWRNDLAGLEHGPAPTVLYGYGSYESCEDPTFSPFRLSLLDRGVVFALAHVRGGGELGRAWYEGGKLANKMNTFTDFLACAHALVDGGWSEPGRIIARGGSAGGLLVGAAMNLEPATFAGVVAEVPFVDCVTTMLDASLPLTVGEYEEWGNPESSPEVFHTMLSYSPYDNVAGVDQAGNPITYPDLYVTAGLNDSRVGYFEPAKWVAKIRSVSPASTVIFHTDLGAGHGGPSGRYESWRDEAKVATFILSTFAKD